MRTKRLAGFVVAACTALLLAPVPEDAAAGRGGRGYSRSGGRSMGSIRGSGRSVRPAPPPGAWSPVSPVPRSASDAARGSYGTTRDALRMQTGVSSVPRSVTDAAVGAVPGGRAYGDRVSPERRDGRREAASEWYGDLTPAQKAGARHRVEDRHDRREDYRHRRHYDDDYWHGYWWYGYYPAEDYVYPEPPCNAVSETVGGTTYRRCGSTWYESNYYQGDVVWVVRAPPGGAEARDAAGLEQVVVSGRQYYYGDGTFYQRRLESGRLSYFVVEPPVGARVERLPRDAVEVEGEGKGLFRYENGYYRKRETSQGTRYEIVAPPPG